VIAKNPLTELLAAPLCPDWTIEWLADRLLAVIAAQRSGGAEEFFLDAGTTADPQSRRILRPLLACLATMSAAEAGASTNLYGGQLSFKRPDSEGRPVWILGQFENKPGAVRVAFRRSSSPPEKSTEMTSPNTALTSGVSPTPSAKPTLSNLAVTGRGRPPAVNAGSSRWSMTLFASPRR
jgi:hypothetical protein